MKVTLPPLAEPLAEAWRVLFDLATEYPEGWALAGSQMVIAHAAAHGIDRPLVTEDADVLIDVRLLSTADAAGWLRRQGFELDSISPDGVGHRFRRGRVTIDAVTMDDGPVGAVPMPDWLGAVLLKARAVSGVPAQRRKHAQDLALLLSLPVDVRVWGGELAGRDGHHLRRAREHLDERAWRAVAGAVDVRLGQAALALLLG